MIQRHLKLKLTQDQRRKCEAWLFRTTGVYNWVIRKMEQDAQGGKYWTAYGLMYEVVGHSKKCDVPSKMLCGTIARAYQACGLAVREWTCADCGTAQDRDVNAALNTLMLGARSALGTEIASNARGAGAGDRGER